MADPVVANQIFLPWVQPGVAANLADTAIDKLAPTQPSVATVDVQLVVNAEPPLTKTLRLYGPGDVTGIDQHQVLRTEPKARTTDFEPNYFAAIEFDRPDFPWLFTPAKADTAPTATGQLRPWLCLVVVKKQQGVELRPPGTLPLPVLSIATPAKPADELPDLSESWAWAHVQLTATDKSQIKQNLDTQPARNLSRLLCPRRLEPSTDYIACVVPAFEVGRRSGLGEPVPPVEEKLKPAWESGTKSPLQVTLPVYYSWEFRTGVGSDFEELVRRLQPRELPPEVGKRPMDISQPGFKMVPKPEPTTPGAVLGLEGALRVLNTRADDWANDTRVPFQNTLMPILNTPWQLATKIDAPGDPVLGPPVYGCWHAADHDVTNAPQSTWPPAQWLNELNLDPRHRVVAALGTQVIQNQQEALMASAWAQLGDIQKINQRRRQAQLSRAVNERVHNKTFSRFSEETLLRVISPAQSRILLEERPPNQPTAPPVITPLIGKIASSFVPSNVVSAPMRKLLRPRGAINRQFTLAQSTGAFNLIGFFNTPPAPPPAPSRAGITIDQISDALPFTDPLRSVIRSARINANAIASRTPFPSNLAAYRQSFIDHQNYLMFTFFTFIFFEFRTPFNAANVKTLALASLNPARSVNDAVAGSLKIASPGLLTGDPLDPVMDAPSFPQPMYEALRDISQDFLLPGLEHVPPNTVQLLQTNSKFIESFMVGLNHEMGRELLWRDYPTDQRGTYFQQFWDTSATVGSGQLDIPPIHLWGTRSLGSNLLGSVGEKVVLLIRGELLRRYPGTVIYAVRAILQGGKPVPTTDEVFPIFRGSLEPDVTFLGFNLKPSDVTTSPGYFFVLQQQPTEPRFGLDDDPFGPGDDGKVPPLENWDKLNWAHLAPTPEALKAITHVLLSRVNLQPTTPQKATWRRNSAHMAYITRQRPVRVVIHAAEMIPR